MKNKKLLPIAVLAALILGGCAGNTKPSTSRSSSEGSTASESSSQDSGSPSESSSSDTTQYGVAITNKAALQAADWYNGATRELDIALTPEGNVTLELSRGNLTVASSNPAVVSVQGLALTAESQGEATITVTYHGETDTVAVTTAGEEPVQAQSLQEIRAGIADGSIKKDDELTFYTTITATFEPTGGDNGHVYSGIYSQDGEYPMVLYAGKTSQYWDSENLAIGDTVFVKGAFSPYSGLNEVKPTVMTKVDAADAASLVTAPTTITLTGDNFTPANLLNKDGALVHFENLVYKSGEITSTNAADKQDATLKFAATKTDGSTVDVDVVARYHLASGLADLKTLVDGLEVGDICTIDAVALHSGGTSPKVSLSLQYLQGKTPAQCIVKTGHEELPAPTALAISGPQEVERGKTIQLTATPTPADANPAVVWTSENQDIATVAEDGKVTGVAKGTATIKATSAKDDSVFAEYEVEVVLPLADVVATPVAATAYKLGFYQTHKDLAKDLFFSGEMSGNYGATIENPFEAADVEMVATEGGYHLKVTVGETVKYINTQLNYGVKDNKANPSVSMKLENDPVQVWQYNEEYNTMTAAITGFEADHEGLDYTGGNDTYYMGTYNNYATMSMSKISFAKTSIVSHFYKTNAQDLKAITVSGQDGKTSIKDNETLQMVATPNAGAELGDVVWSVDEESVATISASGLLTPVAAGTVKVTATSGSIHGEMDVEIVSSAATYQSVAKYTITNSKDGTAVTDGATIVGWFTKTSGENIVTSASAPTYVYPGANGGSGDTAWESGNMLKIGKASSGGSLTLGLSQNVAKVVITGYGWKNTLVLTVNTVTSTAFQTALANKTTVAAGTTADGTFEISSSNSITISTNNTAICITAIEFFALQ